MSNFTFNTGVPTTGHTPSQDYNTMRDNNVSDFDIWNVEHLGFNVNNGGTHTQTGFANFQAAPVLPSDLGANNPSVAYPQQGVADASNAQYYFKNPNATFLLNCVKAFGAFTTGAVPVLANSYNVVSVTNVLGAYKIQLNANCTVGNNIIFIPYVNLLSSFISSFTYANPIITFNVSNTTSFPVNFIVLQA